MMDFADTSYPRPQLVREQWTDLCGDWQFRYDDDDVGLTEHWYTGNEPFDRVIVVPFPPESVRSGIGDTTHHPAVWYRREFTAPSGDRTLLHFGAVDYRASVWVDGNLVVTHEGGHTPFSADITDVLRQRPATGIDGEPSRHTVMVRAEDRPTDASQPRGKQDWRIEPHSIWYHRTTGIWQAVWLEPVPQLYITDLAWTPDPAAARVRLDVELNRYPRKAAAIRVTLSLGDEILAEQSWRVESDRASLEITVAALRHGQDRDRLLWTPEHPALVRAVVTLIDADGPAVDTVPAVDSVQCYLGLRSAGVESGHFLLNGEPYIPRMVLSQGYWPESHLAAPDDLALRREVELIKDFGFNGVRVHQKLEDPRFLYWCDVLGLLVWGEMANAYEFGTVAVERLVREWTEAVRRDRSHPCVVTWVPLNESWGVQDIGVCARQQHYATALYHLTHALDGSRPVISNDGWQHTESDIVSIHDYAATGGELAERYGTADAVAAALASMGVTRRRVLLGDAVRGDRPIMITEFGGLSYAPDEGENWFGYAAVADQAELSSRLAGMVGALLSSSEVAGFCYTQLADTEQESNGLLTADRRPKVDPAVFRRVISAPSRSLPAERVDLERAMAESQGRIDDAILDLNGRKDGVIDIVRT